MIELFNPTSAAISLSGYYVQYLAANGNWGFKVALTATNSVPAHGWYLVAGTGYSGTPAKNDNLAGSNMSATAGHALLTNSSTQATCTASNIVDKVGYGSTATCPEKGEPGNIPSAPGSGQTVVRKPNDSTGNGQDTDVNSSDFQLATSPVFHNASSTPATVPSGLGSVGMTLYLSIPRFGSHAGMGRGGFGHGLPCLSRHDEEFHGRKPFGLAAATMLS